MPRARRYIASLVAIGILAAASIAGLTVLDARPKLGLDLRGGVSVVLTAEGDEVTAEVLERTAEIIRSRVDQLGTTEPEVTRSGDDTIIVQLPGIEEPERALRVIGRTAQLNFRPVLGVLDPQSAQAQGWELTDGDPPEREVYFPGGEPEEELWFHLGSSEVRGDQVSDAYAAPGERVASMWTVQLELNREGARRFQEITRALAPQGGAPGGQLGIVLDRRVASAPAVQQEIREGRAQISGTFTEREARDLALVLRTGALPIELEQSQVQRVSPTLGAASLRAGLLAGLIGLALVALYMLAFYRLLGVITLVGLGLFGVLILGLIGAIGAARGFTLTLAGVAGLIVAVGIAADSYIVYFERIKDELKAGKTFRTAVDRAFSSAFRTNLAGNSVAFAAAIVLYMLAIGPVRGFALTLGIAVVLDVFMLYFFAHPCVALIARNRRVAGLRGVGMREAVPV